MTTTTDIVNRALQLIGTRTTVTDAELAANSTNEAIQANLVLDNIRRRLLRMAPWGCALRTANLVYITSVPGTPENTTTGVTQWAPGLPSPPWLYEYQQPNDCLRACWIVPSGNMRPVRFKVHTDTFIPVVSAAVAAGGTGYVIGDVITTALGVSANGWPLGAPVQLQVTGVSSGAVTAIAVISQTLGGTSGGSYFAIQANPVAQASTSGVGTGASFNLTQVSAGIQRVILTNQQNATLVYVRDVTDPNVMDDMFQDTWAKVLAATMTMALQGDAKIANSLINMANAAVIEARTVDGDEGLTINDSTPDWIRARGAYFPNQAYSTGGYDWGALWPSL